MGEENSEPHLCAMKRRQKRSNRSDSSGFYLEVEVGNGIEKERYSYYSLYLRVMQLQPI